MHVFQKFNSRTLWEQLKKSFLPLNEGSQRKPRILYLDFVKFFAAFLTVFYHLSYYYLNYDYIPGALYFPNLERVIMCFASCCVPLFFIVNGSLMFARERKIGDVYQKAIKILLLTLIWSFLDFPSWFFKSLCMLYVLFPLFQYFYNRNRRVYYLICVLVLLFPFMYNLAVMVIKCAEVPDITFFGFTLPFSSFQRTGFMTLYSILYFLLGPILASAKKSPIYIDCMLILFGLSLVVLECVFYTNTNGAMFDGVNAAFPTLGALLLSMGLFLLFKKFTFKAIAKPLLLVCNGIFAIYVLHNAVIALLPVAVKDSLPMAILIAFAVCLAGGFVGKLASKIPIICWFFKI